MVAAEHPHQEPLSPESTPSAKERLEALGGEILLLPDHSGSSNVFERDFFYYHPNKGFSRFDRNLRIVEEIPLETLSEEVLEWWPEMIAYFKEIRVKAARILREMKSPKPKGLPGEYVPEPVSHVGQTVESRFGGKYLGEKEKVFYPDGELEALLGEEFSSSDKEVVAVSSSHATTAYTVKEAVENRENQGDITVGVVVFDTHADVLKSPAWKERPAKNSTFTHLLYKQSETKVDQVAIFGPPKGMVDEITEKRVEGREGDPYLDVLDRTKIVGEDEYTQEGKVNWQLLAEKVDEVIEGWKKAGITNVVISVDADILRMWKMSYTAPEYNPLLAFTFLASQDFDQFEYYGDIYRRLIWEIKEEHRDNPIAWYTGRLGSAGLSLGQLGKAIDRVVRTARDNDIEVGIKLSGGGRFIGDIAEAGWPDYKERTARAVGSLALRMIESAKEKPAGL